jgi:hypothetical protein
MLFRRGFVGGRPIAAARYSNAFLKALRDLGQAIAGATLGRIISVARNLEMSRRQRAGGAEKLAMFAAKLLVTGVCFWYVSRQIDLEQVLSAVPLLDFCWAAKTTMVMMGRVMLPAAVIPLKLKKAAS